MEDGQTGAPEGSRLEGQTSGRGDARVAREPGWAPLSPELDPIAVEMLADCPSLGSKEAAAAAIAAVRDDPEGDIYGWLDGPELIAVYGLRKAGLSYELLWLAVARAKRGRRYGRSALVDALRRCGRKPMTLVADEPGKGGRRPDAGGGFRYRMGWYAPRLPQEAGYGAH
jgi:GNAT superfamily N-acetyltransferase